MKCLPAPALLHDDRLLVLALHTTQRGVETEIVAVAALDRHGAVLLHTSVRSARPIPALRDAPPIEVVWPALAALLTGRIIVGLHVAADRRLLRLSARRLGATLMYTEWRAVGAWSRPCTDRPATLYPTRSVLTEARTALAALRGLAYPPIHVPPPRRVFWRYL